MFQSSFKIISFSLFLVGGCLFILGSSHASVTSEDIVNGKALYGKACLLCHGEGGEGDGPASFFIGSYSAPRPRNFTSGTFKFRSTPSGEMPTDQDLFRTITEGIPGFMPSFYRMSENERWNLVAYIKTFSMDFMNEILLPLTLKASPIAFTTKSVQRGGDLYGKFGCGKCHGENGEGGSGFSYSEDLKDSSGLSIRATDLTSPSFFKGGSSPESIARSILTGLDGTPMPSYLGTLSPGENDLWHLVHFILSLSRAPSPP